MSINFGGADLAAARTGGLGHRGAPGSSLSTARHIATERPPAPRDSVQVTLRVFSSKLTAHLELSAENLRMWLVNTTDPMPYRHVNVQIGRPGFIPAWLWPTKTRQVHMVSLAQELLVHLRLRRQLPELGEIRLAFGACPVVHIDNAGPLFAS
ncbi:MAG: hypothetical protein A3D26_04820 [Candidatus Blackburnbacteria bacterium RIFCSPHIGHO2_02_FULL_44_20]|uniref:Uncharacterized protein n=1 Tax=Candidatus Blackburnbacteria bacterium RIFCSPHIGHO2_02_FULL_44_20 TaxID=1797516 RepID=A0A1G1V4I2_9BACT|nr:MAG: hypothetical protein A3D26_04820 [Candidatus Blackburnbacteria bacterium RIFCSPHIGHO2_02_FULL_44_20]